MPKDNTASKSSQRNILDEALNRPSMKRVRLRAGVMRISSASYLVLQKQALRFLKQILVDSLLVTKCKRNTIVGTAAVQFALEKAGRPMYI